MLAKRSCIEDTATNEERFELVRQYNGDGNLISPPAPYSSSFSYFLISIKKNCLLNGKMPIDYL